MIKSIYVFPPMRGAGGMPYYWMAYREGEEGQGARGWGTTAREAEKALKDAPQQDERQPA